MSQLHSAALSLAGHHNWDEIQVEQVATGIERQMIVGAQMMICRLRLAPYTVTAPHHHPHEQITFVERGRVRFLLGEKESVARAGDVIHIPSDCWHGASMLDEEVILIDIFSPLREDFLAPKKS